MQTWLLPYTARLWILGGLMVSGVETTIVCVDVGVSSSSIDVVMHALVVSAVAISDAPLGSTQIRLHSVKVLEG